MTDSTTVLADHSIVIENDRIAWLGPSHDAPIPPDARIVDGGGKFVLPGLIDMHVHLEYLNDPDILKLFVGHGVTTVRSMDGRPFVLSWRDAVRARGLAGPDIITAGPIIDGSPPLLNDNLSVSNGQQAREAVARQASAGYDFVKLYENLSIAALEAAIAEARSRALLVTGHIPRNVELASVLPHYWTLEHLVELGGAVADPEAAAPGWARLILAASLDAERARATADRLAAGDTVVVATLIERDRSIGSNSDIERWAGDAAMRDLPGDVIEYWLETSRTVTERLDSADHELVRQGRRNRLALAQILHERGVLLAVGTDTPNVWVAPGSSVHLELAAFVEAGLAPGEALRAATAIPGAALSRWGVRGIVAAGARADLLVVSENPLADVTNIAALSGVVLAGEWLNETELEVFRGALAD